jgi:anti-sigma regulatory factor (Ser/Thr protein kinase)
MNGQTWELPLAAVRAVWDTSPEMIVVTTGPEHRITYQNPAHEAVFGRRPIGVPITEAFPQTDPAPPSRLDAVFATGEVVREPRRLVRVPDTAGRQVFMSYVMAPLRGPDSRPVGVVITGLDETAQESTERAARRAHLLADLGERMNTAREPMAALRGLTDALVPALADVAAVYVVGDEQAAGPGMRPVVMSIATALEPLGPPPTSRTRGTTIWSDTLNAGTAVATEVNEQTLPLLATDPDVAAWLERAKARSIALVPLAAGGGMIGALVLLGTGERPPYADHDLTLFEDLTARAGVVMSDVRMARRQRQVARDLQRSLLPIAPPSLPDIAAAARFVAGTEDVEVGGDWWDVQDLGAGRLAVGVGDVSGRGVPAAIVMGHARAAMRAAGHAGLEPAEVLELLDLQLAEIVPIRDSERGAPPKFATACYALLDPLSGQLKVANAGHVPFLVRSPEGSVEVVRVPPGAPLGLRFGDYVDVNVAFPPGSTLAMFTDGLAESRHMELDDGVEAVRVLLEKHQDLSDLNSVAENILLQMRELHGQDDDVALILLRLASTARPIATYDTTLSTVGEVPATRHAIRKMLDRAGVGCANDVEQVVAELLANAVQHGQGRVTAHAHVAHTRVVVEVSDFGQAHPIRRLAEWSDEGGRGLVVTGALASRWGVRRTLGGKAVWAEFSPAVKV